ncbi:unnamed protein product [Rhizoctonia solani]|uniref:Uncharacterized protein n=1 Tax=Rhizoctonia solani TaxID=456999 RepID=A0A8H2XZ62_9AGAM|nr:unnamed protein product [Rhizoctonia solani]
MQVSLTASQPNIGGNPSNVVLAFLSAVTRARPNTLIIAFLGGDGGGFEIARRLASFGIQFHWFSPKELRWAGCQLKRLDSDWDVKKIKPVFDKKEWSEDMRSVDDYGLGIFSNKICSVTALYVEERCPKCDVVVCTIVDALRGELPRAKSDQPSPAVLDAESYLQDTHLFERIGGPLIRLEALVFGQVLPTIEGDVSDPTADICTNLPAGYAHAKSSKIIIQPALSLVVDDEFLEEAIGLIHKDFESRYCHLHSHRPPTSYSF